MITLPACIDPHVHFRTPGPNHQEDWKTAALAAIAGGVTTVFDMPNNTPSCTSLENLHRKKQLIDQQLQEVKIPLRYHLYFGVTQDNLKKIPSIFALKLFMGSSTGDLLVFDPASLKRIFQIAAERDLLLAVHAEDEATLQKYKKTFQNCHDVAMHSQIRHREAAIKAVEQVIALSEQYQTRTYLLHVSTTEELDLIRQAKKKGLSIYAETTPHHLFLTENDYKHLGTQAQVNPPLRTPSDQESLWTAIHDGTIDTIGSDHAPHTLKEKKRPYPQSPSGIPGVEMTLPLLLNAYNEGKLSIEHIVKLCRTNIEKIFRIKPNNDSIVIDLEKKQPVCSEKLLSKCKWSPYSGKIIKGWPIYTTIGDHTYDLEALRNNPHLVARPSSHL